MKADYHLHSAFSDDSQNPMENVIKEAISKDFDEICFTDHVDYGIKYDRDTLTDDQIREYEPKFLLNVDYPSYFKALDKYRKKYNNKINIKRGLEFGVQTHTIEDYNRLFDKYDYDFVIMSCHQVDDKEFWNNDYQKDLTQEEFYKGYYQEILDVIKKFHNYSILGHLDHHVRYDSGDVLESEEVDQLIDEILKTAIADGKGIEVNTSYYRYKLNDLTPSKKILKRYKELGGEILTIGSDAHNEGDLGDHFEETIDILKDIGFKGFYTFTDMKPEFHPFE